MSTVDQKDKAPTAQSRGDYRLPSDGPHRYVKKTVDSEKDKASEPAYVIAVTKREVADAKDSPGPSRSKYDPEELRAKAKSFLNSPQITSEQKAVLKDILGTEEEPKP